MWIRQLLSYTETKGASDMRIKLFGRTILTGKDLSGYVGRADDFYSLITQKYGIDYTKKDRLKAYKNVVYGCVSLIGEACGAYEPILQRKNGDQWEAIDHEFINLLNQPSGRDVKSTSFTGFDLWENTVSYQLLQGDCFWYMALGKTTGRPREIVVLRPDKVGTDIDKETGDINGYFLRRSDGEAIPLEVNEVLRFPLFNPEDPYNGKGGVEAGSDYIATDESTATYTKNFFYNNAGLSGVLNIKGEVTKGAFRKFVRAWRDKYEGVQNAGKVAIIRDSDANFTKVGLGLDELNMGELRKMSLADVAMIFKVPLELLGKITEGAGLGRGNIETLEYIFAKYNIDKKMTRFDGVIMFALQRYYGLDPNQFRVVHENVIPEDKEFELNERDKGVDKWLKRNEIRDEEGLDPVDGGDQLFVPLTSVPINEASLAAPANDPNANTQNSIRIKLIRRTPGATEPIKAAPLKLKAKKVSVNGDVLIKNANERFRLSLMRNQLKYERQYKRILKPIFKEQEKEALVNLEAHASAAKAANQKLFNDSNYDDQMVEDLTPMLVDLSKTQGGIALVFAGDTENEFNVTAPIQAALARGTRRMATNFNDQTLEALNATLAEGIQAGEGLGELKKRVGSVYSDLNSYRLERIARTETLKASNNATLWAYKQTGYITGKAWAVNPDACDQCVDFDGKTVPLDEAFLGQGESHTFTDENGDEQSIANDYDTIETPPLHPNCRCTIVPVR